MKVLPLEKDFSQFSILDLHKADHSIPANLGPWQFQISVDLSSISADWQGDDDELISDHGSIHDRISSDPGSGVSRPDGYLTPFLISAKKCKITLSLK